MELTLFGEFRVMDERCRALLTCGELCCRQSDDGDGKLLDDDEKLPRLVEGAGGGGVALTFDHGVLGGSTAVDDGVPMAGEAACFWILAAQEPGGALCAEEGAGVFHPNLVGVCCMVGAGFVLSLGVCCVVMGDGPKAAARLFAGVARVPRFFLESVATDCHS